MKKNMKRKKGMALAGVLLTMTMVFMLCALMVTLSLYGSQISALSTKSYERRATLEMIGADFVRSPETVLSDYTARGYSYYSTETETTSADPTSIIYKKGSVIRVVEETDATVLYVYASIAKMNASKPLMTVTCDKVTEAGVTTRTLRSWTYNFS